MCVRNVYQGQIKKAALAKLPDEFWGYRICDKITNHFRKKEGYYPLFQDMSIRFKRGINTAKQKRIYFSHHKRWYISGFHFFLTREDMKHWLGDALYGQRRMRCRIKKEWITAIGEQGDKRCVVVSKAIFPKYCK